MILSYAGVIRPLTTASFPEIPNTCLRVETLPNGLTEFEFAGDLTARQQWLVRIRASSPDDVTDSLMQSYFDSLADLRTIRNTVGTLTAAQLSNAVRSLATAQIRAARLMFGDTGYPTE